MEELNQIRSDFLHAACFVAVYVLEAHAADEWPMATPSAGGGGKGGGNRCPNQPKTLEDRQVVASEFQQEHDLQWPLLLDSMDNDFEREYQAWPERLYIVQAAGEGEDGCSTAPATVRFKSEPGPHGFFPQHVRSWLQQHCVDNNIDGNNVST